MVAAEAGLMQIQLRAGAVWRCAEVVPEEQDRRRELKS